MERQGGEWDWGTRYEILKESIKSFFLKKKVGVNIL